MLIEYDDENHTVTQTERNGVQTIFEYMEDYFGTLYGKVTGKCPLYA